MAVKPETLDNPERNLELKTREHQPPAAPAEADDKGAVAELQQLRQRIAAAEAMHAPKDDQPHCGDCFRRGWRAALRALEG